MPEVKTVDDIIADSLCHADPRSPLYQYIYGVCEPIPEAPCGSCDACLCGRDHLARLLLCSIEETKIARDELRHLGQKVAHGCTDAFCPECDNPDYNKENG
jgi:hypothetical protein